MEKIIELCNNKLTEKNYEGFAALESPTGTGKTLSLLCSILSWVNEMKIRKQNIYNGKIIYTTRTHSQINQVINELKKTTYKPKTAILSSRKFSCINHGLRNFCKDKTEKLDINRLNIVCRNSRKNCDYKNDKIVESQFLPENTLIDIEDLCLEGKQKLFCPYYFEKEKVKNNAELILMPYNYLFNEDILKNSNLNLNNNIIIIDEAHNIRKVCENEKSFEISENDFNDIDKELCSLINKRKKLEISSEELLNMISEEEISQLKSLVEQIKIKICNISLENIYLNNGKNISFKELKNLIISSKKSIDNSTNVDNETDEKFEKMSFDKNIITLKMLKSCYEFYKSKESKILLIIKLFSILNEFLIAPIIENSYCLYICEEQIRENIAFNYERKLKVFCFNPEMTFREITQNKPFAIILTSGNLKPFDILEKELCIKFNVRFENNHLINDDQFKFTIITGAEYKNQVKEFKFDFYNRNNEEMILSLGNLLINLCKLNNNGGILVFFPSYAFLNKCYTIWNSNEINKKIEQYKSINLDSYSFNLLPNKIMKSDNKNFILFSVYRGSSSEGIDFS